MDSDAIQNIRYKLQKRLKRLNTVDHRIFHNTLKQSWGFLQQNSVTKGILDDLERHSTLQESHADSTVSGRPQVGTSEAENDGICYWVVKKCAESDQRDIEIQVGHRLTSETKFDDCIEAFLRMYVEPLFDCIDEQIDDKRLTLALIKKYKHRCEWFRRTDLFDKCKADTRKGEAVLAYDLYEYIHDQGLQFHIEPQSESGRVDLISAQSGRDRLIADAKIFDPHRSHDRGYIIKGFRQIYEYSKDYNEPVGFLVIFKTCEEDLSIATPQQEAALPFVTHNNKTIFLVVIDIFEYPASASKRGLLKSYEITPEQFVASLDDAAEKSKGECIGSAADPDDKA